MHLHYCLSLFVPLTGSFSIAEAHTWLRAVLPGLPAAPASSAGGTTLHRHVRLGSLLGSSYSAGRAVLVAEHASTLATAHDALLAAATAAGARVGARLTLGCDALNHGMRLLWPAFEVAAREARRRRLWTALQVRAPHRSGGRLDNGHTKFHLDK